MPLGPDVHPREGLPSINETFGAVLIGTFVGLMLYGVTVHQSFRYFQLYPSDDRYLKITVLLLLLTDTLHTIECIHVCYYYLVESYFNPFNLLDGIWSIRLLIPSTSFMILIMQAFYVRRVYMLKSGNTGRHVHVIVSIIAVMCMISMLAFCVVSTTETFIQVSLLKWQRYTWILSGIYGSAVTGDVILTSTLIVYLKRSRTGYKQTDSMLSVMTVYTINTGLFTSTLSCLGLISTLVQPETLVYVAVSISATKSYAISVLSVLNSRSTLRDSMSSPKADDFGAFGMRVWTPTPTSSTSTHQRPRIDPGEWDGNPETVIHIRDYQTDLEMTDLEEATSGKSVLTGAGIVPDEC